MFRTSNQVASIALTFFAALFLAKGSLGLSVKTIVGLAGSQWDYHPELIRNLAQQRADSWAGCVFLLAALGFQMWYPLLDPIWDDTAHTGAYALTILLVVVAAIVARYIANAMARKTEAQVIATMREDAGENPESPQN